MTSEGFSPQGLQSLVPGPKSLTWSHLALLGSLVALILGGLFFYQTQARSYRQKAYNELKAIAELKVHQIKGWEAERVLDAHLLMESVALVQDARLIQKHSDPKAMERVRARFQRMLGFTTYNEIHLVGQDGTILFGSRENRSLYPEEKSALERAFRLQQMASTDLYLSEANGDAQMSSIMPLFESPRGQEPPQVGLLLVIRASRFLYPLIQSWPTPSRSAETLLVRKEGADVLYLNELKHQKATAHRLRISLQKTQIPAVQAVLGKEGLFEGLDYRGVEVVAVLKSVPGTTWHMVAKVDREEAYAEWHLAAQLILALILALLGCVGALGWNFWQKRQRLHLERLGEARNEALASEARFQSLFENMAEGVALHSLILNEAGEPQDYRIVEANPQFEQHTGLSLANIQGKTTREAYGTEEPPFLEIYGRVALTGKAERMEVYFPPMEKHFSISVAPWGHKGFATIFSDITDRKLAQKALEELTLSLEQRVEDRTAQLTAVNKELDAFAYSVSHDLRAPLRALEGFSQALVEDYGELLDANGKNFLDRIRKASIRMGHLIEDLLQLSRLTRREMERKEVDLSRLALEIVEDLRSPDPQRKLEVIVQPNLRAFGDPTLLHAMLENLLGNSSSWWKTIPMMWPSPYGL